MIKTIMFSLPIPPHSVLASAVIYTKNSGLVATLDFENENEKTSLHLRFNKQRAFRKRSELYCTDWHIQDAYDTLCEIEKSDWLAELRAAAPPDRRETWTLRHFMIYIEDLGCLEVVAESAKVEVAPHNSKSIPEEIQGERGR